MIFESLYESSQKGELILIDGGFCHFHLRNDGQLTIREIISIRRGAGREMLDLLISRNPYSVFAKCPSELESNSWYKKMGFCLEGTEITKKGKTLNLWRLKLSPIESKQ